MATSNTNTTNEINLDYIKQLYTIMDEEMQIYKGIADIEKEKHSLLMKGIFTDLEPINNKLADQIKESLKIEQKRLTVSGFVIKELGLPVESSFKDIIENLPEDYSPKFNRIRDEFVNLIEEIKHLNNVNSKIIAESKRLIDVTLNAYIDGESSIEINYGNQIKNKMGRVVTTSNPKLFNRTV